MSAVKPKSPNGRPSAYRVEFAAMAYQLCLLGATDKEMAQTFDVSEQTLNAWKQKHPKFLESLKAGKGIANGEVAESLFKRAMGYSHPDVHITVCKGKIVKTKITKHYAPDTTACIFFLKNREPGKWRDVSKVQHEGTVEVEHSDADQIRSELLKRGVQSPVLTGRN